MASVWSRPSQRRTSSTAVASRCTVDRRVWRIGRRWRTALEIFHRPTAASFFFQPFLADETEFGQAIAQGLQFDGGLARVRVGDAAGEQIGVIGEDVDALAATGNAKRKTVRG